MLPPEIFDLIETASRARAGKFSLPMRCSALAKRRKLYGYEFEGTRYDLGDRVGYITAQIGFGLKRPDVADRLRAYLDTVASRKV